MDLFAADISAAADSLGPFDRLDLAQRVGACLLMPENGANVIRLTLAASILSTLPAARDLPTISTSRWRRWLGDPVFRSVRSKEDPPSNPFTETIVFYGGSYTVLPGNAERSSSLLQMLLRATFLSDQAGSALSDEFRRAARDLALAALALSNACATKAGLRRDEKAHTTPTDEVVQPRGERLARLRGAVTFSQAELEAQLSPLGVDPDALSSLTIEAGSAMAPGVDVDHLPVHQRPILNIDGYYVLIAPGSLPAALTHAILAKAHDFGDLPALADGIRDASFASVDYALNLLGCSLLSGPEMSEDPAFPATRALYRIDIDKVLELILLTNPLQDFDPTTIGGDWSPENLGERVAEEVLAMEDRMATSEVAPNGVLALVAFDSPVSMGLGKSRFALPLLLAVADLEVMAHTEPSHHLLLWQYAKACDQLRDYARVWAFDPLDEFSAWRDLGFTYHTSYMSDDHSPTDVVIAPGSAVDTRIEARDGFGVHGMLAANGQGTVEVIRFYKPDIPIYMPGPGTVPTFSLAVDGLPLALWVEAIRTFSDSRFEQLMHGLVDLIAYWIWQFERHLHETLERLANRFDPLVLEVDFVESEAWFDGNALPGMPLEMQGTDRGFKLTFREEAAALLYGPDNGGEREVVRLLLETLHDAGRAAVGAEDRPSEATVIQALNAHAPLGPKKKLILVPGEVHTVLNESDLPPYRPLQPAVLEEWRGREQGLIERLNLPPGPIQPEQRVPTLNRMVTEWFASFEQLVATFNPEGLLDSLVAYGERLIQREEGERKLMPARIACFGGVPEMLQELVPSGPTLATTAIAHRFVTEYVAARPPSGLRPFGLEAYDEVIALAAVLIRRGLGSDAIHYGLADTQLTVLDSGRLDGRATDYEAAFVAFGMRAYEEQITHSMADFPAIFEVPAEPAPELPVSISDLDAATKAEFGISMTRISQFLQALVDIGEDQEGPIKRLPESQARERLSSDLGWSDAELDVAFSLLALRPRAEFLDPPPGFNRKDLYPWAFNRRLSHLSCPLLLRQESSGSLELLWGTRALIHTSEYLVRQLIDGRIQGQSVEMRSLQGTIANHYGEVFNHQVADAYEAVQRLIVRRRVTSIADQRIEREPGQPLGDIDVFVADPLSKELLLVETKDFSPVRTPVEFANEERKLREALKTHGERAAWTSAHLKDVLRWLSIDEARSDWSVRQLLVVSGETFTPRLRDLPVTVITLSTLRDGLSARQGSRRQRRAREGSRKRRQDR